VSQTLIVLLNVDVDGKVSIDVSHLVFEAFCDTSDQVLNDGLHSSEGSDVLSRAMVDFDVHKLLVFRALGQSEGNSNM
jgi:hypothetical protein